MICLSAGLSSAVSMVSLLKIQRIGPDGPRMWSAQCAKDGGAWTVKYSAQGNLPRVNRQDPGLGRDGLRLGQQFGLTDTGGANTRRPPAEGHAMPS